MSNEKLDVIIDAVTENTTTLGGIGAQSAKTSAAMVDARTYIQRVAENTDWSKNSAKIAGVLNSILAADRTVLNESAHAAKRLQSLSVELSHKVNQAAGQLDTEAKRLHGVAGRLEEAAEQSKQGYWRKMGILALVGLLTASLGLFGGYFYAKASLEKIWFSEMGEDLKGPNREKYCDYADGKMQTSDTGNTACFFWEPPKPAE